MAESKWYRVTEGNRIVNSVKDEEYLGGDDIQMTEEQANAHLGNGIVVELDKERRVLDDAARARRVQAIESPVERLKARFDKRIAAARSFAAENGIDGAAPMGWDLLTDLLLAKGVEI